LTKQSECVTCGWEKGSGVTVDRTHSNVHWAGVIGVSETAIRRHFKHSVQPARPFGKAEQVQKLNGETESHSDGRKSVTAIRARPITLDDAREWIESTGDNPEDYTLSVRSTAYGEDLFSNKMSATPKPGKKLSPVIDVDAFAILQELRNGSLVAPIKQKYAGTSAFVLSINDTQFGKSEGGGTPATLARMERFIQLAEARIEELILSGRELGTLVVLGGGDIVEGCVIYPNQSYSLDLDRRGQINVAVATILNVLDRLAPKFPAVKVLASRGNHGENRINGNRTTLYDNDDTLVFEMASLATQRDPRLEHVEYVIAQDEAGVYSDVCGWRLAVTHGDVYGKGVAGATVDKKAQAWYKNMAMSRDPLGSADVLIGNHWHHDKMSDWGSCLWRQAPAQDGGSEWFRQTSGEYSLPGMLTFVMSEAERYSDEKVLR